MHGYSRTEIERRFLLSHLPDLTAATRGWHIVDRYLPGTRLRLRRATEITSGQVTLKFTQKAPSGGGGPVQGDTTNTYLTEDEYALLATLPADVITKTRYSLPPLGVDVFAGELAGLVIAEAEFETEADALAFAPPSSCAVEVTDDGRFQGGTLVRSNWEDVEQALTEYGVAPLT